MKQKALAEKLAAPMAPGTLFVLRRPWALSSSKRRLRASGDFTKLSIAAVSSTWTTGFPMVTGVGYVLTNWATHSSTRAATAFSWTPAPTWSPAATKKRRTALPWTCSFQMMSSGKWQSSPLTPWPSALASAMSWPPTGWPAWPQRRDCHNCRVAVFFLTPSRVRLCVKYAPYNAHFHFSLDFTATTATKHEKAQVFRPFHKLP